MGYRQAGTVALAQVVCVWIAIGGKVIEPHRRTRILISQRDDG